jgi:hypothetical protein
MKLRYLAEETGSWFYRAIDTFTTHAEDRAASGYGRRMSLWKLGGDRVWEGIYEGE